MKTLTALLLSTLVLVQAQAHHAEAMFDHTHPLTVTGAVKNYLWANPHTLIYLETTAPSGKPEVIVFEGGPASIMKTHGWTRVTLKAGDKLTLTYYPRRDGKSGGMLLTATTTDGKIMSWRATATP